MPDDQLPGLIVGVIVGLGILAQVVAIVEGIRNTKSNSKRDDPVNELQTMMLKQMAARIEFLELQLRLQETKPIDEKVKADGNE